MFRTPSRSSSHASMLLESLESRAFLSVTSATLAANEAAIVADGASASAALKTFVIDAKAVTATLVGDLKTLPKSNAPLIATLKADELRQEATLKTDLALLLKPSGALAKKSTATGQSLLIKATTKNLAVAGAEITALGSVTTAPLANLKSALESNAIKADLQALITANPTATQLATDIATAETTTKVPLETLQTSAEQFSTDIATLATNLSSVQTAVGTFPSLVGTFIGTSTATTGKHAGQVSNFTLVIASEDASGNVTGTLTNTDKGNAFSLTATVSLNGKFIATFSSGGGSGTLTGQLDSGNSTLSGTYKSNFDSGTFSFPKTA